MNRRLPTGGDRISRRREFLGQLSQSGALLALTPLLARGQGANISAETLDGIAGALEQDLQPAAALETDTMQFWDSQVRRPSELLAAGVRSRGVLTTASDQTEFLFFDPNEGLRLASAMEPEGLPARGIVQLTCRADQMRLSLADRDEFRRLKTGALRVDLQQVDAIPGLAEGLAWTAVTGLAPEPGVPRTQKSPALIEPGRTWGKLGRVPLHGGVGFWTWNCFLQSETGGWGRVLRTVRAARSVLIPELGLPAIALSSLKSLDLLFGSLQAADRSKWVFRSTDVALYGTREGRERIPGAAIPLKSGDYVIVRSGQLPQFKSLVEHVELKRGLIVPKGTSDFDVAQAETEVLPDVSYLTVSVRATVE